MWNQNSELVKSGIVPVRLLVPELKITALCSSPARAEMVSRPCRIVVAPSNDPPGSKLVPLSSMVVLVPGLPLVEFALAYWTVLQSGPSGAKIRAS